jgi:hypothetical protein
MPVTDLKVSLRKKGATDFASDGFRLLPITKKEYVLGLMGPDGKIDPNLIPAWLYAARQQAGIADLSFSTPIDIDNIFKDVVGFNMSTPPTPESGAQGMYVEVTTAGTLTNTSLNAAEYELIGGGDEGVRTFPLDLETGDYIVLVKVNSSNPKYSFAIVDNTYGDASTTAKGIVKLYDGVDSASAVLAATANSVKQAYDLAASKEDAFSKGTAFNKNFAGSGVATTVSRSDHTHSTFAYTNADLAGNIIKSITVSNGIITALTTQSLASIANAAGLALLIDLDAKANITYVDSEISTLAAYVDQGDASLRTDVNANELLAKKGLEYYTSVASADAGGHNAGDIVAVLEA